MSYSNINKSSDFFNTVLYNGNGGTQSITGVGFQPDWLWIKRRDASGGHNLYDVVRGNTKRLESHSTGAEATTSDISSFDSDGFTVNTTGVNTSSATYASWNWKANGAGSTNYDGSITSTVSANTTAGFSIVKYAGNNTAGATVGHGLGAVPKMIIFKELGGTNGWHVYHHSIGNNAVQVLDQNASNYSPNNFLNSTNPTSSIFTLGQNGGSNGTAGMIAYCFAEKQGYSKFGSYTGNGNANGTFIYTGFKPAWVMFKRTSSTAPWNIFDNKRAEFNVVQKGLLANSSNAEFTGTNRCDFLSNGIKLRGSAVAPNVSGESYIFMAFGQSLVGSNNVPCTAR